jgi:hypothetical protein
MEMIRQREDNRINQAKRGSVVGQNAAAKAKLTVYVAQTCFVTITQCADFQLRRRKRGGKMMVLCNGPAPNNAEPYLVRADMGGCMFACLFEIFGIHTSGENVLCLL